MLNRIYILISIVLVIALAITGVTAARTLSAYHNERSESQLLAAARIVQEELAAGEDYEAALGKVLRVYDDDLVNIRLTIVDRLGKVVYDNLAIAEEMENHLQRPEIAYALGSKSTGTSIRHSSTLDEEMLYLAILDQDSGLVIRTAMPLITHKANINGVLLTIFLVLLISLAILLLVGLFSARIITRPLIRLKEAALAIAGGNYTARVLRMGEDDGEVAALANSFNQMAEKLEETVEDLEDKNVRLDAMLNAITSPLIAVDQEMAVRFMNGPACELFGRELDPENVVYPLLLVTHSSETEKMVARALDSCQHVSGEITLQTDKGEGVFNIIASPFLSSRSSGAILSFHNLSQARVLQKMRSEFVANVTHELRTPLTSIRGFIETLRNGAINNPAVAERFLEIIDIEADHLHRLISDILVLSEIEELAAETDVEKFNLNELIEEVAVMLDDMAAEKKVALKLGDTEEPLPVQANRQRIRQILVNLVDNAIKYNREQGTVEIKASRLDKNTVQLQVSDTGFGIPPEQQERVFERFYRVDSSRSREISGTGLGLSIVKHIAQLYAGKAEVDSRPGEGSTFIVTLHI